MEVYFVAFAFSLGRRLGQALAFGAGLAVVMWGIWRTDPAGQLWIHYLA